MWPAQSPKWSLHYEELMKIITVERLPEVTLQRIIDNSETFPIEFPIESVRCKNLIGQTTEEILKGNINSVYPVLHENALILYSEFLQHKRKFGTDIERELYKDMTLEMLIDRLLRKRAVAFVGPRDRYMLIDGFGRSGKWELIGKSNYLYNTIFYR